MSICCWMSGEVRLSEKVCIDVRRFSPWIILQLVWGRFGGHYIVDMGEIDNFYTEPITCSPAQVVSTKWSKLVGEAAELTTSAPQSQKTM